MNKFSSMKNNLFFSLHYYAVNCSYQLHIFLLVSWMESSRWRSWRRNYIPILTRRRPQHLAIALRACLAGGLGGGHTSKSTLLSERAFCVCPSFKLHRSRRFRGQIVEHSIHVIHLIYYSIHHLLQH